MLKVFCTMVRLLFHHPLRNFVYTFRWLWLCVLCYVWLVDVLFPFIVYFVFRKLIKDLDLGKYLFEYCVMPTYIASKAKIFAVWCVFLGMLLVRCCFFEVSFSINTSIFITLNIETGNCVFFFIFLYELFNKFTYTYLHMRRYFLK